MIQATRLGALLMFVVAPGCSDDQAPGNTGGGSATNGAGGQASGGGATTASGGQGGAGGESVGGTGGGGGPGFPVNQGFPAQWNNGTNCAQEEDVQVWAFAEDTYILRQSLCSNFEGPFLYLLLGQDKALLQDTGTGDVNIAGVVSGLVSDFAAARGIAPPELVVSHSHSHGDHVGGDSQFNGSGVTVIGTSTNAVISYFGFADWPNDAVSIDLGGRTVDVVGIPGHQSAHVALYDRRHSLLFTGDTLYPGRLYIDDFGAYLASTQRLVGFVQARALPVQYVLGTHIEMTTTAEVDFAFGVSAHPNEHGLALGFEHIVELSQGVADMSGAPQIEAHDDFIIYPL